MIIAGKNGKIYLAFLLCIPFFIPNLFSQSLIFNNLTVKDGLSNNKVNAILQDKNGFIWIGTEDGLNRFNGYDLKYIVIILRIQILFLMIIYGQCMKIQKVISGLEQKAAN